VLLFPKHLPISTTASLSELGNIQEISAICGNHDVAMFCWCRYGSSRAETCQEETAGFSCIQQENHGSCSFGSSNWNPCFKCRYFNAYCLCSKSFSKL
jgi:hypothetical protein